MVDTENYRLHEQKVHTIAKMVQEYAKIAQPGDYFSLRKASVSHMVPQNDSPRQSDKKINVQDLTEIMDINPEERICVAESGVTFSHLVQETLTYGLMPMCVSELKTITIGGAVAGCSVESLSYKYGGFHDSCLEYEIITGSGEIRVCSPKKDAEIFEMIHGSFGTLGILTMLKFRLIPAKPFVRMDYVKFDSFSKLMETIYKHYKAKDIDCMDAIIHSAKECVLCIGTFVDTAPYSNTYTWNIFYKTTLARDQDYLPTYDYFFRYDADCHWCTRNFGLENTLLRLLLGPFALGSSNILTIADKFPFLAKKNKNPDVVVDVFIAYEKVIAFFEWYLQQFNYFPLWIVPYRMEHYYPWINPNLVKGIKESFFIDCAIYAFEQKDELNYYKILEDKVFELQGIKTLISHNYYDEDMFWKSYNKDTYTRVKTITDPKNLFRQLYQKTNYKKKN
jgi:FAD/FMN-containing dehydrogenase